MRISNDDVMRAIAASMGFIRRRSYRSNHRRFSEPSKLAGHVTDAAGGARYERILRPSKFPGDWQTRSLRLLNYLSLEQQRSY
jgi:hypothetical protein